MDTPEWMFLSHLAFLCPLDWSWFFFLHFINQSINFRYHPTLEIKVKFEVLPSYWDWGEFGKPTNKGFMYFLVDCVRCNIIVCVILFRLGSFSCILEVHLGWANHESWGMLRSPDLVWKLSVSSYPLTYDSKFNDFKLHYYFKF